MHDFVIPELGRAVPYGVYDIADNAGWVSVGIDHDTAAFAANAIRSWWQLMGRERYPNAQRLLITPDGGGSNGSRLRLWKLELQKLADELGLQCNAVAVLNARGMNRNVQQEAERVDQDVALAARNLLACIIALRVERRPPF